MNASAQCRDKGGWLVSIHSEAENAFVVTNLEKQNAWIGFNQIYSGEWNWPDGSDVGFQRWSPGGKVTFPFHSCRSEVFIKIIFYRFKNARIKIDLYIQFKSVCNTFYPTQIYIYILRLRLRFGQNIEGFSVKLHQYFLLFDIQNF